MKSLDQTGGSRARDFLLGCSLLIALGSNWECLCVAPIVAGAPRPDFLRANLGPPSSGSDHVHIFLITGGDPIDFADLERVCAHCQALGFPHTRRGHWYDRTRFEQEIRCIRRHDPKARFALLGYSLGANVVRSMAHRLAHNNDADIDLLVYIAGNLLKYRAKDSPANVAKIVHIMADSSIYREAPTVGADNYQLKNRKHVNSPTDPQTLDILGRELAEVAARVSARD